MLLVLGTHNPKKRAEIAELLEGLDVELDDLRRFPNVGEVVEDGDTFEANARKKATELARGTGQWVLAEDSGLVVQALNGAPGVHSARYAGDHDDNANNQKLIAELAVIPDDKRGAYYVCVAAISNPQGEITAVAEGRCHGIITRELRGSNGFGYDPLFLIPEYHQTFGELSGRVKQALSHRARALTLLRPALHRLRH